MDYEEGTQEYRIESSDDDSSTLPEVKLPSLTPKTEDKSEVRQGPTQNERRDTGVTAHRPPPLVHFASLLPSPSPTKPISEKNVAQKVRKTEQWFKKVKRLNTAYKKQQMSSKIDEDIHAFLKKGGIVAMEEQRRKEVEMEDQISQSLDMSEAVTATEVSSASLPTMDPEAVPLFTAPPVLMHLIDPPDLPQPSSSPPSLEHLLLQASHPELSEMVQGEMVSFWYSTHPCPTAVQEWLIRVSCLCSDTQLASAACRTLCRIATTRANSSSGDSASVGDPTSIGSATVRTLLTEILQLLGARFKGVQSFKPLTCVQHEDDALTSAPCIDQQLRNFAVIVNCYCSTEHLILDGDTNASLVEILLRVLMDPKVLGTPLERDMMIALDSVVSGISEETLSLVTSCVEHYLTQLPCFWQRSYLAQVLVLATHCRRHLAPAFCLACLKDFASLLQAPEHHQPNPAQTPCSVNDFTLEHLKQPTQALHLIETFLCCLSSIPVVQLRFEELYPVFRVVSIMLSVLVAEHANPLLDPRRDGVYVRLCRLSSRIRDAPSTIWPSMFKDLLKRIMNQVKPSIASSYYGDNDSHSAENLST